MTNLGFLYYKDYYRNKKLKPLIKVSEKGDKILVEDDKNIREKNKRLIEFKLNENELIKKDDFFEKLYTHSFCLKTTYPGLVIGIGLMHEIGTDHEFKIGFQFDYTTGLPIIPGSSIKGLLRSVFSGKGNDHLTEYKKTYLKDLLKEIDKKDFSDEDIKNLENEIFCGIGDNNERLPLNQRDIFFAAEIIKGDKNGNIMGEDYITPHPHPLKDPIPLKFLKVLPGVTFQFKFALRDSLRGQFKAEKKNELFKRIILDLGVGAKTNVGYGHLEEK